MVRTCLLMSCVLVALLAVPSSAYPSPSNYFRDDPYDSNEIMEMVNRLENLIQMERKMENYNDEISRKDKAYRNIDELNEIMGPNNKRALDLGLSRGYSGAVHAKHLMGVEAANYAGGPGRRRRDATR